MFAVLKKVTCINAFVFPKVVMECLTQQVFQALCPHVQLSHGFVKHAVLESQTLPVNCVQIQVTSLFWMTNDIFLCDIHRDSKKQSREFYVQVYRMLVGRSGDALCLLNSDISTSLVVMYEDCSVSSQPQYKNGE
jgi:hypothetical protein